jgi:hypothetical protein
MTAERGMWNAESALEKGGGTGANLSTKLSVNKHWKGCEE